MRLLGNGDPVQHTNAGDTTTTSSSSSSSSGNGGLTYLGIIGVALAAGIILFVVAITLWLRYLRARVNNISAANKNEDLVISVDSEDDNAEKQVHIEMKEGCAGVVETAIVF